ncbi:MAG TPA: gliding motility-associated C-terminal domain-containing protein [Bacteroidia bacterium]|jgi:gliding motility-associated-like protein|nr:gliding motility-associated C-terminal domain-containing protein [Bacteroidia bacterium]
MKKVYFFILPWCTLLTFTSLPVRAQQLNPITSVLTSNEIEKGCGPEALDSMIKSATEVESKRTLSSSTYVLKNRQILIKYSSEAINYKDAKGKLTPINIELKSNKTSWVAEQQQNPCYLNADGSTAISIGSGNELSYNLNCKINGHTYNEQGSKTSATQVSFKLSPEVEKKVNFRVNGIETDYIINKPIGTSLVISEEVKFPSGCSFVPHDPNGKEINGKWRGNYALRSNDGSVLSKFTAPLCYDAKGKTCVGYYQFADENGKRILKTIVPDEWLKNATYPITVDPYVSGPVSVWSGGNMPFCFLPTYYTGDSMQVTIPGGITVTQLYIGTSFQSNFAISPIVYTNHGYVIMETSCGKSVTLHNPASGAEFTDLFAGSFDFHSPLTCCYPPSCVDQTFWLKQELARDSAGAGCDTDYLYYSGNPVVFQAYIQGRTDTAYKYTITPAKVCSNNCNVTLKASAQYGVPPYVLTHSWLAVKDTFGKYGGCVSTGATTVTLTIPGCPTFCGKADTVMVPVPIVIDACGDTALNNFKPQKLIINPTPQITASPDTVKVCSGNPISFIITPCIAGTTIAWKATNGSSGSGTPINAVIGDTGTAKTVVFTTTSSLNGCNGDTVKTIAIINPYPVVTVGPSTLLDTVDLGNSQALSATGGGTYSWSPSNSLSCANCANPVATPTATTTYYVSVTNSEGCTVIDSVRLVVVDVNISIPNVFTPNGDGQNDVFYIKGLQYHPGSEIKIYDRWGVLLYTSNTPQAPWDGRTMSGEKVPDGVYYYILTVPNGKKYDGFVQLIR